MREIHTSALNAALGVGAGLRCGSLELASVARPDGA